MTENIENLILEHLHSLRNDIQTVRGEMTKGFHDLTARVGSLEEHVAGLRRDLALLHADIAITHQTPRSPRGTTGANRTKA